MTLTDDFIAAPTKELACQLAAQAWCTPETGDIIMCSPLADAFADILLAVANDRGTCPDCRRLLPENGYCFVYDRAIVGSDIRDFGCSLFARKDAP